MNAPAPDTPRRRWSDPLPTPRWAWAFVLACAAVPVLTTVGPISGAVGFAAAGACFAVARHPGASPGARAAVCLAITLAAYGLVATVLGVAQLAR